MEEMDDINWQAEIKQIVEKTIKERKKQRILARAEERWKDQIPNERGGSGNDKGGQGCSIEPF